METQGAALSGAGDVLAGLGLILPEVWLTLFLLLVLVADLFPALRRRRAGAWLALLGCAASLVATLRLYGAGETAFFSGMAALDPLALFFKLLSATAVGLAVLFSIGFRGLRGQDRGEYYALLLATAIGMNMMAAARNLLLAYLALEMVSLSSYALTAYLRGDRRSSEAGLKYILFGALASGVMLFGLSYLYGLTGHLDFAGIRAGLEGAGGEGLRLTVGISLILVLAGIGYKIAAVPFHLWCPDVYQGAPTPITAFLSVGPKAAGFALFIRFFYDALAGPAAAATGREWTALGGFDWPMLIAVLSAATMTLGNLAAIPQNDIKRLLAYSSIAHAGYLMMPLAVLSRTGITAILFYLVVYLVMNLGAFLIVVAVENRAGHPSIQGFRGLAWRSPAGAFLAVAMTVFLISLTGIPPTGGFAGKLLLFGSLLEGKLYWLALVGVLNSAVSLFYYMRIVRAMFFKGSPVDPGPLVEREVAFGERSWRTLFSEEVVLLEPPSGPGAAAAERRALLAPFARLHILLVGVLLLATLLLGLAWGPLARLAAHSAHFLN